MSLQTSPITLVYCFGFHKLPGFCNHIKVSVALMWQLNRRLRLHSTFFNMLCYLKGGETFAFRSVWSWCYDWRRQAISIYRSEQDSNGKEIRFPVLNAEHFSECLCPVGRPDCSPKPLPSFLCHYFKVGDVDGTVAQLPLCLISCCATICRRFKEFPFPDVSALHSEAVKKHLEPKLLLRRGYFEPLLFIVVLCLPLITVCDLLQRYEGYVPCPPNLLSWPTHSDPQRAFWETKSSLSHLWEPFLVPQAPLQTFPLHQGY